MASDGRSKSGAAWQRGQGSRFEWISSSPSSVVVAELEQLFPDVVQVPVQPLEEEIGRWSDLAILARSLSRWIPSEALVREFQRAGVSGEIEVVPLAHRHFLIRFSNCQAKEFVLGRPWVVNGQPIAMADWMPEFIPSEGSLLQALLWIRLPLLPIEFWTDAVLSSILSVAGQFVFSDASTKDRSRGGFARVCVRIDLSKPLRPGARIRGNGAPFWQQFTYEHLEGICNACGALHLDGDCGLKSASSSSSLGRCFGPWMAAVRRRRTTLDQPASSGKSAPAPSLQPDGWQLPKKVARRQGGRGPLGSPSSSMSPLDSVTARMSPGTKDSENFADLSVPVSATVAGMEGSETVIAEVTETNKLNPFSSGGSSKWSGRPKSREDVHKGPTKRSRPVEPMTQRVISKNAKTKGKAPLSGRGNVQASFAFSAMGSDTLNVTGKMDGLDQGSALGSTQLVGSTHDTAVTLLKKAIQRGITDEPLVSAQLDGCSGLGSEASHPISDHSMEQNDGDIVEVPPPKCLDEDPLLECARCTETLVSVLVWSAAAASWF